MNKTVVFCLLLLAQALIDFSEASPVQRKIPVPASSDNDDRPIKQANGDMPEATAQMEQETPSNVALAPAAGQEEILVPTVPTPAIQQEEIQASTVPDPAIQQEEIQAFTAAPASPNSQAQEQNEEASPIGLSTPKEADAEGLPSITTPVSQAAEETTPVSQAETATSSTSNSKPDKENSEQAEQIDDSEESKETNSAAEQGDSISKPPPTACVHEQNPSPTENGEQAEEDEDSDSESDSDSEEDDYEEYFPSFPENYYDDNYEYGEYYYPDEDEYDYDKRKFQQLFGKSLPKKALVKLMGIQMSKLKLKALKSRPKLL